MAVGSDQESRDKVVKWQNQRSRWGHFAIVKIPGHRGLRTSSYAEQNHSSLAQRVPDNSTRTVEEHIVEVMQRTGDVLDQRQEDLVNWDAAYATDVSKMTRRDRDNLSEARKKLNRVPFLRFQKNYQRYTSYNCKDVGDTCHISHTSNPDKVYILVDGKRCGCESQFAFEDPCAHEICKLVHQKKNAFQMDMFCRTSLLSVALPKVKAVDIDEDFSSLLGDLGTLPANAKQSANAEVAGAGAGPVKTGVCRKRSAAVAFSQPAVSPSKAALDLPSSAISPRTDRRAGDPNANVGFRKINDALRELTSTATRMDNYVQNVVYSVITQLHELLEKGDYDAERHKGTLMEMTAFQLSVLSQKNPPSEEYTDVKVRSHIVKPGPAPKFRLGSDKSTISGGIPRSCGFCLTTGEHPGNQSSCPVKQSYGMCYTVRTKKRDIAKKLQNIVEGKELTYKDLSGVDMYSNKKVIDSPPHATKRFQFKGYKVEKDEKFVLCTCIARDGKILSRKEGLETVTYEEVFIEYLSLIASVGQCDSVFFAPLDPNKLNMCSKN